MFWDTFARIKIIIDQLRPAATTLKGFIGEAVQPMGSIVLPVLVGANRYIATAMKNFLVVRTQSDYNAIIGRPTLNALWAISSTYQLKTKLPT